MLRPRSRLVLEGEGRLVEGVSPGGGDGTTGCENISAAAGRGLLGYIFSFFFSRLSSSGGAAPQWSLPAVNWGIER